MATAECRWKCPSQWSEWSDWLAAGLHARSRWRLPVLLVGMLFASGRRTVTTWLRGCGVSDDFADYYYFLASVGRKTESIATRLVALVLRTLPLPDCLLLVIDDSPTKRYGPKVEGADVHHNPTPGPAGQPFLYGHIWVTISLALRHPQWGPLGLPLRALLYVRQQTLATIPQSRRWPQFATKLQLAASLAEWIVPILNKAGKTVWIVIDGGYTKRPFLRRAWPSRSSSSVACAKTRRCGTCRRCRSAVVGVGLGSMARTKSVSPSAQDNHEVGKRSSVRSTTRPSSKLTKRSSPPTARREASFGSCWSRKIMVGMRSSRPIRMPAFSGFSKHSPTGQRSSKTFTT